MLLCWVNTACMLPPQHHSDGGDPDVDHPTTEAPEVHSLADAAHRLGVTETWLRNKVRRRAVPHHTLGRVVKFTEADIAEIIATGRTPARPAADPEPLAPSRRTRRRSA